MLFANVLIDRKVKELDRYFQYVIPDDLLNEVHIGRDRKSVV